MDGGAAVAISMPSDRQDTCPPNCRDSGSDVPRAVPTRGLTSSAHHDRRCRPVRTTRHRPRTSARMHRDSSSRGVSFFEGRAAPGDSLARSVRPSMNRFHGQPWLRAAAAASVSSKPSIWAGAKPGSNPGTMCCAMTIGNGNGARRPCSKSCNTAGAPVEQPTEHHDRARSRRHDLANRAEAVQHRQLQVHQDHVWTPRDGQRYAGGPVDGGGQELDVALAPQDPLDVSPHGSRILDQQHLHGAAPDGPASRSTRSRNGA